MPGGGGCDQAEQVLPGAGGPSLGASEVTNCPFLSDLQKPGPQTGPQRLFKVVFLGNSGVGKTSFIHRFCTGRLRRELSATVGELGFRSHSVTVATETHKGVPPRRDRLPDEDGHCGRRHRHAAAVGHGRPGEVRPLSAGCISAPSSPVSSLSRLAFAPTKHPATPRALRFCSITEQYYRKADGILAMYDLTQAASFTAVRGWMHSVKVSGRRPAAPFGWGAKHAKPFVSI